jgi:hypothetical protein
MRHVTSLITVFRLAASLAASAPAQRRRGKRPAPSAVSAEKIRRDIAGKSADMLMLQKTSIYTRYCSDLIFFDTTNCGQNIICNTTQLITHTLRGRMLVDRSPRIHNI